ncbi:MAG: hypothetical protein IKB30_00805 [Clostridia bacterium]|nr:hypothetical protein [Clostridia bacterium]
MKFMKKLSVIISLALVITIGGVFAAWNYSNGTATGITTTRALDMASITTTVEKGKITANSTGMTLIVDDDKSVNPQTGTSFKAVLVGTGSINVTFTPDDSADPTVKQNGIPMIATVTVTPAEGTTQWTADDVDKTLVDILAPNTELVPGTENKKNVIDLGTAKVVEIQAQQIIDALIFCGGKDVILDTYAKNQNFVKAMAKYTINITISEKLA